MTVKHVVVDGSNLATEGRALPSLQQLDECVRAYLEEFKPENVTVVVDASFPNRIETRERAEFESAITAGELITPPAGVIGRGDAFLLQIADRVDAVVLSNDSFQEFHGQYGWLFDKGRLIGGKPVPHVGWVFMERSPVRGPQSRRSVSEAKKAEKTLTSSKAAGGRTTAKTATAKRSATHESRSSRGGTSKAATKAPTAKAGATKAGAVKTGAGKAGAKVTSGRTSATKAPAKSAGRPAKSAQPAGARHAELAVAVEAAPSRRRTASGVEPYNEALPFIEFVAAHPLGSKVRGAVERFASHGAYVLVDGTRCYLPLKNAGDPPPRRIREVLTVGQQYTFVVQAFDTPRRGVDLAMPGVVVTGAPAGARASAAGDPVQPTKEERVARGIL